MGNYFSVLTRRGQEISIDAQFQLPQQNVTLDTIVFGSHPFDASENEQTFEQFVTFRDPEYVASNISIVKDSNDPTRGYIEAIIPASEGPFTLTEFYLMTDGDDLFACGRMPPINKSAYIDGFSQDIVLKLWIDYSIVQFLELGPNSEVYATMEYVDNSITTHETTYNHSKLHDQLHAASHATGQPDEITPSAIGASAVGHDHDADYSDINHNHSGVYQPLDTFLTSIAALGTAANKIIYTTAADTAAEASITAFGRSLIDDADAAAARTTIGLGEAAVLNVGTTTGTVAAGDHNHNTTYAPITKGVTGGDAHTHKNGDGSTITEDAIVLSDTTTHDVSTSKHGFCPKAPNDTLKFLRGDGTWAAPSVANADTLDNLHAGQIVNVVHAATGWEASTTTILPFDDTIPQISEGSQILSASITPQNANNRLIIRAILQVDAATSYHIVGALFQNSTANALKAAATYGASGYHLQPLILEHVMTAGSTSSQTFSVRYGPGESGTAYVNSTGTRLFGGVSASSLTIIEVTE